MLILFLRCDILEPMRKKRFFEMGIYTSSIVLVMLIALLTPQFAYTTTDDNSRLTEYLIQYNEDNPQVLGARSNSSSNDCPQDRPVIGWLSYEGYKLLPSKLPPGETPTVCFESYEEAYSQGFVLADF